MMSIIVNTQHLTLTLSYNTALAATACEHVN